MSVIEDIAAERARQIEAEGWTPNCDDEYRNGELARAAASYALHAAFFRDAAEHEWWKPKDRRRDLVRAGALIVAEIERLDRAAAREAQ